MPVAPTTLIRRCPPVKTKTVCVALAIPQTCASVRMGWLLLNYQCNNFPNYRPVWLHNGKTESWPGRHTTLSLINHYDSIIIMIGSHRAAFWLRGEFRGFLQRRCLEWALKSVDLLRNYLRVKLQITLFLASASRAPGTGTWFCPWWGWAAPFSTRAFAQASKKE